MGRARVVLGLAFLLSVAVDAAAQTGSISGVLRDAGTAAQIGGAVTVYAQNGQWLSSGSAGPTTPYQFDGLPPGTYFLQASSAGYVSELHNDIACVAADCPPTVGMPVLVTANSVTTIDFSLTRGGAIAGTVRRASDNSVISGLLVRIYNSSTAFVGQVTTAVDGTYVADGLDTGSYFALTAIAVTTAAVDFVPELYGGLPCPQHVLGTDCRLASSTPIAVTVGATTSGINFSLDAAGTISGRVVAATTLTPLSIPVAVYAGQVQVASTLAAADGQYSITGLPPGAYRLRTLRPGFGPLSAYVDEWFGDVCVGCAGTPAAVGVAPGQTVTGIDFVLTTGGAISGTINCQFFLQPLGSAVPVISVFNASGALVRSENVGCSAMFPGNYLIEGLPSGTYYLLARDIQSLAFLGRGFDSGTLIDELYGETVCMTADCDVRRGVPVVVTAGATTTGRDFNLAEGTSSVLVSEVSLPLSVFDARGVQLVDSVRFSILPPGQQIAGLPPGTYYAKLGDRLHGLGQCSACPPTSGRPIVVGAAHVSFQLDFGSAPTGPSITGTVRVAGMSTPLSTITVELYTHAGVLLDSATTDLNGRYVIPDPARARDLNKPTIGVQSGTYFLRSRNDRGYVDEIYPDVVCASCDVRTGTPVVVGTTDVAGIDFALAAGGVVSGAVTDPVLFDLAGVPVTFFDSGGGQAGQAVTSATGLFRVTLPPGSYRARAEASLTHGAEIFSEQPCTSAACDVSAGTPIPVTTGTITPNISFTLASCSAMTLSPPLLASGVVGRTYRQVFSTSGGVGPYAYQVTEGVPPLGMTLGASSGVLEGTPTVSGRHAFTIGVFDASGCGTARAYTLDVHACAFTLSPSSATLPAAGGTVTVAIADTCEPQTVTGLTFVTVQSNTTGQVVLDVPANTGAAPRTNDLTIGRRVFTVLQAGVASQPPFGALDTPLDGVLVSGSIAVGGWALDDLGVQRVQLFRDPVGGEPPAQVFLGTAVFVAGARPDVAQAYPTYPQNDRAGWGFLILTNMLPNQGNGTFRVYAYADDAEGARTLLGARTINVNNANATLPFGAIDTPAQGETIAGSAYLNWGWALTPQPKIIPFDGSTIQVYVDGVPQGHPIYNLFRADVSGLFPGLANSGGPVGYRTIDTTALAEGQHTIAWVVTDSLGAATGIGSRYFSVANSADAPPMSLTGAGAKAQPTDALAGEAVRSAPSIAVVAGPDRGRRGASLTDAAVADVAVPSQGGDAPPRLLRASDDGTRAIPLHALERLELTLSDTATSCAGTWAGYRVDEDRLSDLPVGAAIDPAGQFYWQPGPGFLGTFHLLFVRTACDGTKTRVPVTVTIKTPPR